MDYREKLDGAYYTPMYEFIKLSGMNLSEQHILAALIKFRMNEPKRKITMSYLNNGAFTNATVYNAKKSLIKKGYMTEDLQWTGKKEPVGRKKSKKPLELSEDLMKYYDRIPNDIDVELLGVERWNEIVTNANINAERNKKNGVVRR